MKIRKNNIILSLCVFALAILCKYIQFTLFPDKYFYDSKHILAVMNGTGYTDKAYTFTANFYNAINIFQLNSIYEWSIFLTTIGTIIIAILFLFNKKRYSIKQLLFIFASIALLDIYVFNLSKEIIQLLIFIIVYLIIKNKKIKNDLTKIAIISSVFIIESITFRIYYLILAALIPICYAAINESKRKNIKSEKIILTTIIAFFAITFVAGYFSPEGLNSILTARSSVNQVRIASGDKDANTMIVEIFGQNDNYLIFCLNYMLDYIRLIFPIELLFKGLKYAPFVIYQFYLSYLVIKSISKYEHDKTLAKSVIIGFISISAIFEPDFGSFIRHQITLYPLLLYLS